MASSPQLLVDIGQHQIKALLVSGGKKGVTVRQAACASLDLPGNAPNEDIQAKTVNVLKDVLKAIGGKKKRAAVALQGRHAFSRPVTVPLIRGRQLDKIIRYEARQQIPFPIDQVNLDYQIQEAVEGATDLDVTLLAVRREVADEVSKSLAAAGAKADIVDVGPVALYNAYCATIKPEEHEVTAVVNIGASGTDIVIEQEGELRFLRSAPIAGNTMTGMLAKEFDIDWAYAEELKKKPADTYGSKEEEHNLAPEDVAAVLERGFEQIVTEVRRSLDFYVSQSDASSVTRVLLCGGSTQMDGVVEFLEERLGVQVLQPDFTQIESVTWSASDRDGFSSEATLMGLVARMVSDKALQFNVAPPYTKRRLDFENRLPLLSVAAVLLAAIIGGGYFLTQLDIEKRREASQRMTAIVRPGGSGQNLSGNVEKLRGLTEQLKEHNKRFGRLEQVRDKRGVQTGYYLELANLVPDEVWLSEILSLSDHLEVIGKTVSEDKLQQFLASVRLSPYFDDGSIFLKEQNVSESGSVNFAVDVLEFCGPSPEEVKFVETLLAVKDLEVLKAVIDAGESGTDPIKAIVGFGKRADDQQILPVLKHIYSALASSNLELDCQSVQWRSYDRLHNEVDPRYDVAVEKLKQYQDNSLGDTEFIETWTKLDVPTPTPTPTPTMAEGEGMGGFGGYGMGYGGFGMMGGMGGPPPEGEE